VVEKAVGEAVGEADGGSVGVSEESATGEPEGERVAPLTK